jgi:hypothetical protein
VGERSFRITTRNLAGAPSSGARIHRRAGSTRVPAFMEITRRTICAFGRKKNRGGSISRQSRHVQSVGPGDLGYPCSRRVRRNQEQRGFSLPIAKHSELADIKQLSMSDTPFSRQLRTPNSLESGGTDSSSQSPEGHLVISQT